MEHLSHQKIEVARVFFQAWAMLPFWCWFGWRWQAGAAVPELVPKSV
jgi:hypothetical protein